MPTAIRTARRNDASSIKVEVVCASNGITARRPPEAVDASVPKSTSSGKQDNPPAAHVLIGLVFALQG